MTMHHVRIVLWGFLLSCVLSQVHKIVDLSWQLQFPLWVMLLMSLDQLIASLRRAAAQDKEAADAH